jgi:hypothetical protein
MTSIISFVQAHPTTVTLVAYYILSAAIGSLPAPGPASSNFYQWFFKFSNTLAGNLTRAFSSKLGGGNGSTPPSVIGRVGAKP